MAIPTKKSFKQLKRANIPSKVTPFLSSLVPEFEGVG